MRLHNVIPDVSPPGTQGLLVIYGHFSIHRQHAEQVEAGLRGCELHHPSNRSCRCSRHSTERQ